MYKNRRLKKPSESHAHWVMFILLPFLSALYSVWNFRASWGKNITWAFIIFYGSTFSLSKESTIEGSESDIVRYAAEVKELYKQPMSVKTAVDYFYETGEADVLRTIIAVFVSRFTDNLNVLTSIYAAIFGFFLTRNMWYIFSRIKNKLKPSMAVLILCFFLVDPFWFINGFRYNTAIQIFVYGLLPYLFERKIKGLFISCSSILVHYSFIIPVLIMFVYVIARNRIHAYFIFFIVSSFISQINITQLNNFIETNMPEVLVEKSATYRDTDVVKDFREKDTGSFTASGVAKNWYAVWYQKSLLWSLMAILTVMYILFRKKIQAQKDLLNIFCFTLFFWGFSNVLASIPSGGRFLSIASMFALAGIVLFLIKYPAEKYLNDLLYFVFPALLLFIVVSVRTGFYSLSLNTLVGNPFLVFFTDYNISLNDIIK